MKHIHLDARHGLAFTLGMLLALAYCASLAGCTDLTAPVVTCRENVVQTAQGPWDAGRYCEAVDPRTGIGHPVPSP